MFVPLAMIRRVGVITLALRTLAACSSLHVASSLAKHRLNLQSTSFMVFFSEAKIVLDASIALRRPSIELFFLLSHLREVTLDSSALWLVIPRNIALLLAADRLVLDISL